MLSTHYARNQCGEPFGYGARLKHGYDYAGLPDDQDVPGVGLNRAVG